MVYPRLEGPQSDFKEHALYSDNQFQASLKVLWVFPWPSPQAGPHLLILCASQHWQPKGEGEGADSAGGLCQSFVRWNVDVLREKDVGVARVSCTETKLPFTSC